MFKKTIWNTSLLFLGLILFVSHSLPSSNLHPSSTALPGTEPWVDPAPVPFDPTEPRHPRPPIPNPYPEPPLPSPLPINVMQDLHELIEQLREEIRLLNSRVQVLEGQMSDRNINNPQKNNSYSSCNAFIPIVKAAIRDLIKMKNNPELANRKLSSQFLVELFQADLLTHIPPFYKKIEGSLAQNFHCVRSSIDQ